MRRSPLRRGKPLANGSKPLRRTTRLRARGNTSHAKRPRGKLYMGWCSTQPCFVRRFWDRLHAAAGRPTWILEQHIDCDGRIEVDHAGCRYKQGNGTRAFDWTCIPLCTRHHRMRTAAGGTLGQAGIFHGYSHEAMRRWCDAAIALNHELAARARIEIPTC